MAVECEPAKEWYAFLESGLKLNAVYLETVYGDLPNLLLQKWPAPEFTCITKLNLSHLMDGEEAGIISMGMRYGLLTFRKDGDWFQPRFIIGVQNYGKILPETVHERANSLPKINCNQAEEIYVKYVVKRVGTQDLNDREKAFPLELVTIEYSTDGKIIRNQAR